MRLIEAKMYRGRQISVYIVHPGEAEALLAPALCVCIDHPHVRGQLLSGCCDLALALEWGRDAVDEDLNMQSRVYKSAG